MRPILLGIVGDSAAGKTTLTKGIAQVLGVDNVTVICTDDYHRYDRAQRKQLGITALHPDANYLDIMQQHLRLLRAGEGGDPRLTLTFAALNAARCAVIWVAGSGKAKRVQEVLSQAVGLPIQGIKPQGSLIWMLDWEAAAALPWV